jgi:hypothetical protein
MKTFESQLLELLREYDEYRSKYIIIPDLEKVPSTLEGFTEWLSKRVEEKDSRRDKLFSICEKYSQSGFLDNVRDNKEEFINAILEL